MDRSKQLLDMIDGYQISQALSVAAELRLSDLLADGPRAVDDLAVACGADAPTLLRLMRALESVGVYECDDSGRFANTELGELLRSDVPESLAEWAIYVGRDYYRRAWGNLLDSVRTGANAFSTVHGLSPWAYRAQHPADQANFNGAMVATAATVVAAVVDAYDFSRFATVADIGGGVGTLLAAILGRFPSVRGVLFDQAEIVAAALPALRVDGLAARCTMASGDFFEAVPGGADAYLLKSIIHDWLDDDAVRILRACRRAMPADGTLLLIEQVLGEGPDVAHTAFSDLNMLVSPGGRERTLDQYAALLDTAGFAPPRAVATTTPAFVIETVPAG